MGFNFPAAPIVGELYPNPEQSGIPQYIWDGSAWQSAPGSGQSTFVERAGDTMLGHLALVENPSAPDAVRKDYVDASIAAIPLPPPTDLSGYLPLSGGTMSGALVVNADITTHRGDTTGYFFPGNSGGRYYGFDGGSMIINGAGANTRIVGPLSADGDITAGGNVWTGATVYFRANGGIYLTHDGSLFSMSHGLNMYGSLVTHGSHVTCVNVYNSNMYASGEIVYGSRLAMTGVHGGNYNLDGTANTIWVANTGMITIISNFSGIVQVNSHTTGSCEIFICGGGSATRFGSASGSAHIGAGYAAPQNGYVFYNSTGTDSQFGVIVLRTRGGA